MAKHTVTGPTSWEALRVRLELRRLKGERAAVLVVAKELIPHPRLSGGQSVVGRPRFQVRDWRFPGTLCKGLHVIEFGEWFEVHIDRDASRCDLPRQLGSDVLPGLRPLLPAGLVLAAVAVFVKVLRPS